MCLQLFISSDSPIPGPWHNGIGNETTVASNATKLPVEWSWRTGPIPWKTSLEELPSTVLLIFFTILQIMLFIFGLLRQITSLFGPTETKVSKGTTIYWSSSILKRLTAVLALPQAWVVHLVVCWLAEHLLEIPYVLENHGILFDWKKIRSLHADLLHRPHCMMQVPTEFPD